MTDVNKQLLHTTSKICKTFKLTPEELRKKSHARKYSYPRFIYCREAINIHPKDVSKRLRVHRTTVYHGIKMCTDVFELQELYRKFMRNDPFTYKYYLSII